MSTKLTKIPLIPSKRALARTAIKALLESDAVMQFGMVNVLELEEWAYQFFVHQWTTLLQTTNLERVAELSDLTVDDFLAVPKVINKLRNGLHTMVERLEERGKLPQGTMAMARENARLTQERVNPTQYFLVNGTHYAIDTVEPTTITPDGVIDVEAEEP